MSMLLKKNNDWKEIKSFIKLKSKWLLSQSWIKIDGVWKTTTSKALLKKILEDNPTKLRRTSFKTIFNENTTGKIFIADGNQTQDGKTVYYFAGNTTNNWVYFAGKYWRIIRTNENGGIRLLYAGDGKSATDVGSSVFNTNKYSESSVGWKYGTDESLANNRKNTNKSTIYNKIETWYNNNIKTLYDDYVDMNAVYYNDRNLASGFSYNSGFFYYAAYTRFVDSKSEPILNCELADRFGGSQSGNNKTVPAGLMTVDEIVFAGGLYSTNSSKVYYYLNATGSESITGSRVWWTMSPEGSNESTVFAVQGSNNPGSFRARAVTDNLIVRPVISLKPDVLWKSGDGTFKNPYKIKQS